MREIKFRAWHKASNKWAEGWILWPDGKVEFPEGGWDAQGCDDSDSVVLMQYTGHKDKNGKEIFDGDIVRVGVFVNADTEFNALQQYVEDFSGDGLKIEVIGNIYENPDLVEKP